VEILGIIQFSESLLSADRDGGWVLDGMAG